MVILNFSGKIEKTFISKKLGLFIANLPNETEDDWLEGIKEELRLAYATEKMVAERYINKYNNGPVNCFEQRILSNAKKVFPEKKYRDECTKGELIEKYIDYVASNMIYIDFDEKVWQGPNKTDDFPCFDNGSCQEEYAEKIVDFISFISADGLNAGDGGYLTSMPYCIYSTSDTKNRDFRHIFSITEDITKYQTSLIKWGHIIDEYLDSNKAYYLLDYLCNALYRHNEDHGAYQFMKLYSLCSLFLEEEHERELDYKLPELFDNNIPDENKKGMAEQMRKIRNKIAHGDFEALNVQLENWAELYMDGHFWYDYFEYSRKGWILGNITFILETIVRKLIIMEITDKKEIEKLKKMKNMNGDNGNVSKEYTEFLTFDEQQDPDQAFLDYYIWLYNQSFEPLEKHLIEGLELKRLLNVNEDEIIEGAVSTTLKERDRKKQSKAFYTSNASCALKVIKEIFTETLWKQLSDKNTPKPVVKRYREIMVELLSDVDLLLQDYQICIKQLTEDICIYKRENIHYGALHHALRQVLYGTISYHSYSDFEIIPAVGIIRQLIELRIRRAFGVLSYSDKDGNILPLDFSKLLEAIGKHIKQVAFPVKFENIKRIYRWSNMYIHSGAIDYSWLPFYLEGYLRALDFGKYSNNEWNVNNGIQTTQTVIDAIQKELLDGVNKPNEVKILFIKFRCKKNSEKQLVTCTPECNIIS